MNPAMLVLTPAIGAELEGFSSTYTPGDRYWGMALSPQIVAQFMEVCLASSAQSMDALPLFTHAFMVGAKSMFLDSKSISRSTPSPSLVTLT